MVRIALAGFLIVVGAQTSNHVVVHVRSCMKRDGQSGHHTAEQRHYTLASTVLWYHEREMTA
jgi:hypothetical protein